MRHRSYRSYRSYRSAITPLFPVLYRCISSPAKVRCKSAPSMKVALFVTGSARTIQLGCTLRRTIENVAMPLGAELYFSVNVPHLTQLRTVREYVHNTTHDRVLVAYEDIYVDEGRYVETPACRRSMGRQQIEGMVRCMRAMEASSKLYHYVIRTRTDLYVPFRLHSLPTIHPSRHLVAYVGFVGGRCNDAKAWFADDRFAILPTIQVQRAYFYGFAKQMCGQACSDSYCYTPECKLGSALTMHNVMPLDLRDTVATADLQIVRGDCLRETTGKHWIRPSSKPPLHLTSHNLSALRPKRQGGKDAKSGRRV